MARWKSLSAEEKEEYKVPRTPRKEGEGGKRKRSEGEEEDDVKKPKSSAKQKLAGFAFAGK